MGPHTKCKYDDRSRCLDQDLISLYCVRAIDAFCCCGECRICMRATSRLYSAIVRPVCCGVRRKMTNRCGEFICRSGIRGFICVGASDSSRVAVAECRERLWCDASRSLRRFGSSALSLRCSFARRMFDMQVASNAGGDAAAKGVHCACSVWSCSPKGGGSLSIFFFFFEGRVVRPHRPTLPLRSSRSHVACILRDWTLCGRRNPSPTLRALLREVAAMSPT